ncbi:hypothetical protein H7K45_09480 [Mycobacterium yunnanensis]|uniref:PE family protein n=1 Tax=Mycobacterium yunnanensis TaxID=368477 RepID=A0A9X2Z285_9MYCO|nr:type VII secretion target [Mycobacterium yunnanensis]MCV7420767.1 hypothetical protein [Mycobacterium yunnanensis]
MGSSPGGYPTLKVDPELLQKYGGQLLAAAGDLPDAPPPFTVTGSDAISQAISEKLQGLEDPIQQQLPQLKTEASDTANNVMAAAGRYSETDAQLAANYEKLQFGEAGGAGGAGAGGAGAALGAGGGAGGAMGQMGQMMSMPMQMASQAAQMPMQAMSALGQVPQGIMQGVQQISQMAGAGSGASSASEVGADKPADGDAPPQDDRREQDDKRSPGAAAGDKSAERAPEPAPPAAAAAPRPGSPRHAAPDPTVEL